VVLHRAGADADLGGAESSPSNPAFPHVEEDDYGMIDVPVSRGRVASIPQGTKRIVEVGVGTRNRGPEGL
jgi:hypothetical protein